MRGHSATAKAPRLRPACLLLTSFAILSLLASSYAGEAKPLVADGARAKGYVEILAADAMEGRQSGAQGYEKASEWVASKFKEWGLEPAGEDGTYFQKVTCHPFEWYTGIPELRVKDRVFPFDDGDFGVSPLSATGATVEAEVVFAGCGISAPAKGLDEYEGLDVAGKIVLAFQGSPRDTPAPARRFRGFGPRPEAAPQGADPWRDESTDAAKIKAAYDKGAAAILLYRPDAEGEEPGRRRWEGVPGKGVFRPERTFLCFTIGDRIARAILRRDPQETLRGFRRRLDRMRREIEEKKVFSEKTGVTISLKGYDTCIEHSEGKGNVTARNVLAKIKGTDPGLAQEAIILGAHLDHVGMRDGYVYNGADDNASGSAVVLEAARILAEGGVAPKRTILFACWCGEEMGLLGSNHYANHPCDGVAMHRVVACFNMDMVGMGDALDASGALNFPEIWEVIVRDQDPEILKVIRPSVGGPGGSDHTPFIERGIEAIFFMSAGGGGHPDYHQPEDDAEKIDPELLRKTAQFVVRGAMNLADETQVKLAIADRERIYRGLRMRIDSINPDLAGSAWSRVALKAADKEALTYEMIEYARDALRGGPPGGGGGGSAPRPQRSMARGLAGLKGFQGDLRLFALASEIYGFGRVDIEGDDGVWIAGGRLTEAGRASIRAMEEQDILIHLVSPGADLIADMLSAAGKPFLITGTYSITDGMADRIPSKGVLLGIDFDPRKVDEFIARVEAAKERLGQRGNLFAFLTSTENLEAAKRALYVGLIAKGWAHNEICGGRGSVGLFGSDFGAFRARRG